MKIIVEVKSAVLTDVKGTSGKGKAFAFRTQTAWAHLYEADGSQAPYPQKFDFIVEDGKDAYPVGKYELSPSALVVGGFGRLEVGRIRLVPVQAQLAGKAA